MVHFFLILVTLLTLFGCGGSLQSHSILSKRPELSVASTSPDGGNLTIPGSPSDLTGFFLSPTSARLQWKEQSDNEDGFIVERRVGGGKFWTLAVVSADTATYDDATIEFGYRYQYRVRAYNGAGESAASNDIVLIASGVPAPPNQFKVYNDGTGILLLQWSNDGIPGDEIEVQRKRASGAFRSLANLPGNASEFHDEDVQVGESYTYRLRAKNSAGKSDYAYSEKIQVSLTPDAPVELAANILGPTKVRLTWRDQSENENGFRVYLHKNGKQLELIGFTGSVAGCNEQVAFVLPPVNPKRDYEICVRAYNGYGESACADVSFRTTPP